MHSLGMDIGTTTVSAVLLDVESGEVLGGYTEKSEANINAESWASLQDVECIWETTEFIRSRLSNFEISSIGLTGQMHGILYTDAHGKAVSPLFTWQDCRGDLIRSDGQTYTQALSAKTGKTLATGYGAVTHAFNLENGLVPENAKWIMTIQDYIGMKLVGQTLPQTHISNSESFGAPDWTMLAKMIRTTDKSICIGTTSDNIPVAIAIGDNQASFIGSVKNSANSILINMGTGGQVSAFTKNVDAIFPNVEKRHYIDGETLLVGYSLCGGYAFCLLEAFFREVQSVTLYTNR
jgi:sedoheptulokinase